jgi:cell shape-determining protein MreC
MSVPPDLMVFSVQIGVAAAFLLYLDRKKRKISGTDIGLETLIWFYLSVILAISQHCSPCLLS